MFIFCEQSQIFGDVDLLNRNKRCFCFDALQRDLCLVTERTIGFRVELKLHRFGFHQNRLKAQVKFIFLH